MIVIDIDQFLTLNSRLDILGLALLVHNFLSQDLWGQSIYSQETTDWICPDNAMIFDDVVSMAHLVVVIHRRVG
jgi:hypothetical protein